MNNLKYLHFNSYQNLFISLFKLKKNHLYIFFIKINQFEGWVSEMKKIVLYFSVCLYNIIKYEWLSSHYNPYYLEFVHKIVAVLQ